MFYFSQNYMRVVEVWLDDEFKEYFYAREPNIRGYPIGNITEQLDFKKRHHCKSFKWFMDNIAYEVYDKFPPPPPNVAWGEVMFYVWMFLYTEFLQKDFPQCFMHYKF